MIMAEGQFFKMAVSPRFVNVSEEEINFMKENAIPRNTKHARKFGMNSWKVNVKIVLNVAKKPFKFLQHSVCFFEQ